MNVHWTQDVGDSWPEIRSELERAFEMSRAAAVKEESFVYVVRHENLLGQNGAGNAMVACGLLSAARTASLEGVKKGWTANVIAHDTEAKAEDVERWAQWMLDSHGVTGELVRLGAAHLGKALP